MSHCVHLNQMPPCSDYTFETKFVDGKEECRIYVGELVEVLGRRKVSEVVPGGSGYNF